jgi:hypothetical protein
MFALGISLVLYPLLVFIGSHRSPRDCPTESLIPPTPAPLPPFPRPPAKLSPSHVAHGLRAAGFIGSPRPIANARTRQAQLLVIVYRFGLRVLCI